MFKFHDVLEQAKTEHPFHTIKNLFRNCRTRYRRQPRNETHSLTLFRPVNLALCVSLIIATGVFANEPPRPGEIEYLKKTGKFEERLAAARALGNHRMDLNLLKQAVYKAQRSALSQKGIDAGEIIFTPPPRWHGMPTKGNVKTFALLIDFLDHPGHNTRDEINSALFSNGSLMPANSYPYESLRNYYQRSSYGQLDLSSGTTLGWYHAPYNRSEVPMTTAGRQNLIKEAISALGESTDFTQFDNDNDGVIDYFMVIWAGPNNGWSNFWWGMQTSFGDSSYMIDGKRLGKFSWNWECKDGTKNPLSTTVVIHETGHALGLPDLYDYDNSTGPSGGVGGLDMMDGNWGDHNCFSKWVLDWITPTVVNSGNYTLTLNPSGSSADAVLIMPGAAASNPFGEFFMAQNRYRTGNDADYPADGMLIWHIDAALNESAQDYNYNNSYTAHKLVKLMEADGLNRIEQINIRADAGMYFKPGNAFGSETSPSSKNYQGVFSRARVSDITQAESQMAAAFSIEDPGAGGYTLTVTKSGVGRGSINSSDGGISCGDDCAESYLHGQETTITATAAPGARFLGWIGGGCSGTGSCTVNLNSDTEITASFDTTLILSEDFESSSSNLLPAGWTSVDNSHSARWSVSKVTGNGIDQGYWAAGMNYTSAVNYHDTELRSPTMNLSAYNSVVIEFNSVFYFGIGDVDISVNGGAGPWTNVLRNTTFISSPQTYNVDITAAAAGHNNVMLRFRLYGESLYWLIDNVKITGSQPEDEAAALANTSQPVYWYYFEKDNNWYIAETISGSNPAVLLLDSIDLNVDGGIRWKPVNNYPAFAGFPAAGNNFSSINISPDGRTVQFGDLNSSQTDPDLTRLANTSQSVKWFYTALNDMTRWFITEATAQSDPAVAFLKYVDPSFESGIRWKPISNYPAFGGFPAAPVRFQSISISNDGKTIQFGNLK